MQVLSHLDTEDDINAVSDYFSYEHFYVIYCKFWELDTDHDLVIDKSDLTRHAGGGRLCLLSDMECVVRYTIVCVGNGVSIDYDHADRVLNLDLVNEEFRSKL